MTRADADRADLPLTFRERALYHQIHPAKLATDILAEVVSLICFWRHDVWLGLASHVIPPIIASALVMRFAGLAPQRASWFGRYVDKYMTRRVEAARLAGDLVAVAGAWLRSWTLIALGLVVVAFAWLSAAIVERLHVGRSIGI